MSDKVLVINKYHFISGGAERYFFSIMDALHRRGVEPVPFSVDYPQSVDTPYRKYFMRSLLKPGSAKIVYHDPGIITKTRLAARAIYSREAKRAVKKILQEEKPKSVYLLNINNHISPSVIDACADAGVRVVMRLSDFNMICPANMYYREKGMCTDCKHGLHHCVKNKCIHGSLARSAVAAAAVWMHRRLGVYKKVHAFVTPSNFMKKELESLGHAQEKIHWIPTFFRAPESKYVPRMDDPYVLFVGRFVPYKGPELAIRAFARCKNRKNCRLVLMGDEDDEEAKRLKQIASELNARVEFLPFEKERSKVLKLTGESLFTVVPSRFYENLPNTILESFGCGRPVVATDLGSIPETVTDGWNGLLFRLDDEDDFARQMDRLIDDDALRESMAANAREDVFKKFSEELHLQRLFPLLGLS